MIMKSAEHLSLNSNYYVMTPDDYKIEKDCPFKEIFICSDLKKELSKVRIKPSQVIFIEYNFIEEKGFIAGELSNKINSRVVKTSGTELKYRLIVRGFHYKETEPIFEERFAIEPDTSSWDFLGTVYTYLNGFLKGLIERLNYDTGLGSEKSNVNYCINHFQFANRHIGERKEICRISEPTIENEIEAEMLFEGFYSNRCNSYINSMKNYSCGILFENAVEPSILAKSFKKGDLIISFCGVTVYGFYSIKNALISGCCE